MITYKFNHVIKPKHNKDPYYNPYNQTDIIQSDWMWEVLE